MHTFSKNRGSITLETAIVLPFFLFAFLMVFSMFPIISARNQISHALIQATKSLSMDSYIQEKVSYRSESDENFWGGLADIASDIYRSNVYGDQYFSSQTDWYATTTATDVVKDRFIGFLTGGNTTSADEVLKGLSVKDGLSGMTFEYAVNDGELTVTIKYQLQYMFDFAELGEIPMEQSVSTQMWGVKERASAAGGGGGYSW